VSIKGSRWFSLLLILFRLTFLCYRYPTATITINHKLPMDSSQLKYASLLAASDPREQMNTRKERPSSAFSHKYSIASSDTLYHSKSDETKNAFSNPTKVNIAVDLKLPVC
jgi:hypothetical protein